MRRWWIIPALAAAVAAVGFAYWGYGAAQDNRRMVTYLNNRNQRAFYEMVGHVQTMEVMLSKGIVSNSPMQRQMLFADIWQQAYAAQENLTQVPMPGPTMTRTSKFLNQTGDYAWSLAKKYARGVAVKQSEIDKLNELHKQAGYLAAELNQIETTATGGRLLWGEIKKGTDTKLSPKEASVPLKLQRLDKNMNGFPTLIYDGPFSDHINKRKPKGLTGQPVNAKQAAVIAERFAEAGSTVNFRMLRTQNISGSLPAFRVHLAPQGKDAPVVYVDVSKKGGHVLTMINTRFADKTTISADKAITIASQFLASQKNKDMQPTYMVEQRNAGTIIFEYKQDGVLIYPDLMKVKVALDNGEVLGFEGLSFITNHYNRKLPKPKITEAEAAKKVNPQLKVKTSKLALIPLENLQEVLAYEFSGDLNGDNFIVYINALTGQEERILKVIDTNGGPVTM